MFRYEHVNSTRKFTIVAEIVSLSRKIYKRNAPFRAVFEVKTLAVLFPPYPCEIKTNTRNLDLPPFWHLFVSIEMVQSIPTRALSRARDLSMRTHLTAVDVVACSFWDARVINWNTLRKPFEFKWPEVRFNRKQTIRTSMTLMPYNKLPGAIIGDGNRERTPFLILGLAPWYGTLFLLLQQIAPSPAAHARGFSWMLRGQNGVWNSRNRFMLFSFGPQLNAFMAVGILLKYFCRKLLQFEWRQCRI